MQIHTLLLRVVLATGVSPRWTALRPDYQRPNAGLPVVPGVEHIVIFTPVRNIRGHSLSLSPPP